jgi:hypothetical protein
VPWAMYVLWCEGDRMPPTTALPLRWLGEVLMAGELTAWLAGSPVDRQAARELVQVQRNAGLSAARVAGVVQVSQAAMLGTLGIAMAKREAALLVPEDAAKFDLIATQAALAMAGQINRVAW